MFSYSIFNMAPDAKLEKSILSFTWAEISIQRLELSFKTRSITRDVTKIEKAYLHADTAVAEWILNAGIKDITWTKFKQQFTMEALNFRNTAIHLMVEKKVYEPIDIFLERSYKRYLEYGLTETEFESMLRLKTNDSKYTNQIERVNSQRGFANKKLVIELIIAEEKEQRFAERKIANLINAKKRKENQVNYISDKSNKMEKTMIKLNNKNILAIKDTGSDINIISKDLVKENKIPTITTEEKIIKNHKKYTRR
jgi:hypothetical protein